MKAGVATFGFMGSCEVYVCICRDLSVPKELLVGG